MVLLLVAKHGMHDLDKNIFNDRDTLFLDHDLTIVALKVKSMGAMDEELVTLRTQAEEATRLQGALQQAEENTLRLEGLYQVEQASTQEVLS